MNSPPNKTEFKCATWNARSLIKKNPQCETFLYQNNLDLLSVTETWFSSKSTKFKIRGYNCIRCDRDSQTPGGGSAIFIKEQYLFEKMDLVGPWLEFVQIVGIRIKSILGQLYVISIYIPPNSKITENIIGEMTLKIPTDGKIVIMGDFNAHLPGFLPYHNNRLGRLVSQLQENLELNIVNDGKPTYLSSHYQGGSVLDLQMVSSDLALVCSSQTLEERFDSDHFPVMLTIPIQMETTCQSSTRLQTKRVDWINFQERVLHKFTNFNNDLGNTAEYYDEITQAIVDSLLESGAYLPRQTINAPIKPSWWTMECEESIKGKKNARKAYLRDPSRENLELYMEIEKNSNKTLLEQKKNLLENSAIPYPLPWDQNESGAL